MKECMNTCPLVSRLPESARQALIVEAADMCLSGVMQRQLPICGSENEQAKSNVMRAAVDASRAIRGLSESTTMQAQVSVVRQAHRDNTYFVR